MKNWRTFNRCAIVVQVYWVGGCAWNHNLRDAVIWGLMAIGNAAYHWREAPGLYGKERA